MFFFFNRTYFEDKLNFQSLKSINIEGISFFYQGTIRYTSIAFADDVPPSSAAPAAAASATASSVALPVLVAPATHRGSTTTTIRRLSDADRLLIEALETGRERSRHTGRFLTMHKRRRKRLTTRSLSQDPGILDDILHGQVQVHISNILISILTGPEISP